MIAFLVWRGAPIIPNAFIDQPRPPNFQYFPNLDAVIYDRTALSLLATGKLQTYIGTGDALWIGRRPLLAVFLAGLHWLSGGDYSQLIMIQLGFFSLLPVLVYLFTKTLHNRFSGVLTAGIIIVRNLNGSLAAGGCLGGDFSADVDVRYSGHDVCGSVFIFGIALDQRSREGVHFPAYLRGCAGVGHVDPSGIGDHAPCCWVGWLSHLPKKIWLAGRPAEPNAGWVGDRDHSLDNQELPGDRKVVPG